MNRLGIMLVIAALLVGCTPEGTQPTPAAIPATPTAPPTAAPSPQPAPTIPPAVPTATSPAAIATAPTATVKPAEHSGAFCLDADGSQGERDDLNEIIEYLGYAFHPSELPGGFRLADISTSQNAVKQTYQSADNNLIEIAYPVGFSPDEKVDSLGWTRPDDAVDPLIMGERTAYLMTGGWSYVSVLGGPAINPSDAVWDYNKSLTLFFTCRADDGRDIAMAIQAVQAIAALPEPIDWIDAGGIVELAQSLKRIRR